MATKDEITSKINSKIVKDGNIRAVDTNEILRDILDFSNTGITQNTTNINNIEQRVIVLENKPETDNYKPFSFWDENSLLSEEDIANLWYSFRGIENTSVNFTFRLVIRKANFTSFTFRIDPEISETLNRFFQQFDNALMSFVVSVTDVDKKTPRIWTMSLRFRKDVLRITLKKETEGTNDTIRQQDEVFTSVYFHCPPFNFDRK
ncbi:hypothetical protein [Chryseobacterium gambrini]|uniref:Uncharacterized protein n=1 Tax=Chryseobacterium gambrini TaxID=373672 RepID=A0ABM8K6L9_9FLAO|nr:hypothetical protein CRDW_20380 [Chryseobacterium gambrini]